MRFRLHTLLLSFLLLPLPCLAEELPTSDSLRELAVRYEHGRGVQKDYEKAFQLYCLAADRGDREAYYALGWMYFNSRGVEQNPAIAAGWFKKAADAGDPAATRMVSLLAATDPQPDPHCTPLAARKRPGREEIEQWVRVRAPAYGLDPELVLSVIWAESNFNPRAHSVKDARGLMQLIPDTARRFGVTDSWDPAQNLHGGMAYLQWLMQRFDGDVPLVLAAYNAGENAVDAYQGIPPYPETRNYVKRISRHYPKLRHPVIDSPVVSMING
ncbi:transglycosylase SLT domain-containing protein [Sedimenticola thiotaurini]|uniref:Transglycosylase SLT domain-containing protein n=1 Tax=Sedimenticola thiotaurini TaxID=1543721 RepID=A0A0F7K0H4_9GAMM|nr:transglycosylase SLT domain-containing protein [Sedimenticola thiotaurini]AKH22026.1 hypothetical protein AAY24_03580 [Sedimenticola thiotaurini]